MKIKIIGNIVVLAMCLIMVNCEDDKELASILGSWQGNQVEFKLNSIPITSSELELGLDFNSDGTVIYKENNLTASGTYEMSGASLTISGIETDRLPVDVSGQYVIRELTDSRLVLEGERDGEINDPTYGTISGKVKATLIFDKVSE